jgi:hypothetical protein
MFVSKQPTTCLHYDNTQIGLKTKSMQSYMKDIQHDKVVLTTKYSQSKSVLYGEQTHKVNIVYSVYVCVHPITHKEIGP